MNKSFSWSFFIPIRSCTVQWWCDRFCKIIHLPLHTHTSSKIYVQLLGWDIQDCLGLSGGQVLWSPFITGTILCLLALVMSFKNWYLKYILMTLPSTGCHWQLISLPIINVVRSRQVIWGLYFFITHWLLNHQRLKNKFSGITQSTSYSVSLPGVNGLKQLKLSWLVCSFQRERSLVRSSMTSTSVSSFLWSM